MKKHLVVIAFIMAGTVVFAQEKGRGHRRDVADNMRKELSLSDDQYTRIQSIDEAYRARFHDLRIDSTKTREENMKSMRSLGDARRKEIGGVLTEQQRETWHASQTARRDEHRAHSQKVAEDRVMKIKTELGMTDTQFSKFQNANKVFRENASKLKQQSLSDENRKDAFRKLRNDYDKSMKSILNKAQYKKWTEMKKNHHGHHGPHTRDSKGS